MKERERDKNNVVENRFIKSQIKERYKTDKPEEKKKINSVKNIFDEKKTELKKTWNKFIMREEEKDKLNEGIMLPNRSLDRIGRNYKKEDYLGKKEPQRTIQSYFSINKMTQKEKPEIYIPSSSNNRYDNKNEDNNTLTKAHYLMMGNVPKNVEKKEESKITKPIFEPKRNEKSEKNLKAFKNRVDQIEITNKEKDMQLNSFRYSSIASEKKQDKEEKKVFDKKFDEIDKQNKPKRALIKDKSEGFLKVSKYNREVIRESPITKTTKNIYERELQTEFKNKEDSLRNRFLINNEKDKNKEKDKDAKLYTKNINYTSVDSKNRDKNQIMRTSQKAMERSPQIKIKTDTANLNSRYISKKEDYKSKSPISKYEKKTFQKPDTIQTSYNKDIYIRSDINKKEEVKSPKISKGMKYTTSQGNIFNNRNDLSPNKNYNNNYNKKTSNINSKEEHSMIKSKTLDKPLNKQKEERNIVQKYDYVNGANERLKERYINKEKEEKERKDKENKLAKEKIEREKIQKERQEKLKQERERKELEKQKEKEKERKEKERKEKEKIDIEKKEKEKKEREKREKERIEREKQEKLERQRKEQERQNKLEKERRERERAEKERQDQLERQKREREKEEKQKKLEKEKLEKERQQKLEKEKKEREKNRLDQLEKERKEKERREWERGKQEKMEKERKERRDKEKQEQFESERKEKERKERENREKLERERKERESREKLERERKERENREKLERERKEKERLERENREKFERERKERENREKLERENREKFERERKERENREKLERERKERGNREKLERERKDKENRERLERERKERENREILERERQEQLEKERKEREKLKREKQEKIEKEKREREKQEKLEKERQEQFENDRKERERIKKEKQERLEKERQQQLERERIEKEKLEQKGKEMEYKKYREIEIEKPKIGGSRFKTYKTDDRSFNKLNILSPTENNINSSNRFRKSIEDKQKSYKQLEEEKWKKDEDFINPIMKRKLFRTTAHSPVPQQLRKEEDKVEQIYEEPESFASKKKKYTKRNIPEDESKKDNDKDESIKNIFVIKKQQIKEEEQKQTNEEVTPKEYKRKRFGKKLAEEEENEKQNINNENRIISSYGKKSNKFNKSPSEENLLSYDNIKKTYSINQNVGFDFNNGTITVGNIRGKSTKIKIYKCVIWKNTNPNIDENTIKNMIRRSGSQILNNGGFVINLSRNNSLSTKIFEHK